MITRVSCAVLLFAALALFASSSAAAPPHSEETDRPVATARAPSPSATPTLEERCTTMLWEWIGPYWELGDPATPAGLEARYSSCTTTWYTGSWVVG